MSYEQHRITNASVEGINSQIKTLWESACGFRNKKRFRTATLFHFDDLDLYPVTCTENPEGPHFMNKRWKLSKNIRKNADWWARFTHSTPSLYDFRNFLMRLSRGLAKRVFGFNDDALESFDLKWRRYYKQEMESKSVLDIGCGPAAHSKEIMETVDASSFFGVDISFGLLASAAIAYPTYYFCVADASNLPFHNKSIDVVITNFTFHHIEVANRSLALKELMRVSRRVVILRDVFGVGKGFLGSLYKYYYSIVDGSFHRYTLRIQKLIKSHFK